MSSGRRLMGFLVIGLLGGRIVAAQAYQDPYHRRRRCPSEHHPSTCGDKGRWDPCLDHEYCLGRTHRAAPLPLPTPPPAAPRQRGAVMCVIDGDSPETNDPASRCHPSARKRSHSPARQPQGGDRGRWSAQSRPGGHCLGHDHVGYLQLLEELLAEFMVVRSHRARRAVVFARMAACAVGVDRAARKVLNPPRRAIGPGKGLAENSAP
jgi:hypothetical protein